MITAKLDHNQEMRFYFQHEQFFEPFADYDERGNYLGNVDEIVPRLIPGTNRAYARGKTRCIIVTGPREQELVLGTGIAYCSHEDNFSKEQGRRISLDRAIRSISGWEAFRGQILNAYFTRNKKGDANGNRAEDSRNVYVVVDPIVRRVGARTTDVLND